MNLRPCVLLAALALAGGAFAAPTPAAAASMEVSCAGIHTMTYTPGLHVDPDSTTVRESGNLLACTSASDPSVTSGTWHDSAAATLSCGQPDPDVPVSMPTISWSNGRTSQLVVSRNTMLGVTALVGAVSSGEFAGATVAMIVALPPFDPRDCASDDGVSARTGTAVLTIDSF